MISNVDSITTLTGFYESMQFLHKVRKSILNAILNSESIKIKDLISLERIKLQLEHIPLKNKLYTLKSSQEQDIFLELDYEMGEIKKDGIFLKLGPNALKDYLCRIHPNYLEEVDEGLKFLEQFKFDHFVTDRDGTVSNYCGRYRSSIQSIHNALCLSEFSKAVDGKSIILTSAPLFKHGLEEVSILPQEDYILSGSKGREILIHNEKHYFPLAKEEKDKLQELEIEIQQLLKEENYSVFKHIGSGFQQKFGQITLARQDKNHSITAEKSEKLKKNVENIIKIIDPEETFFGLEDTGYDLEIMLKVRSQNDSLQEFDKGHGLKFIIKQLNEHINNRTILICGDTASDVPMLRAAKELGAKVVCVFVTEDENLQKMVSSVCKHCHFVSSPDILIYMLYKYAEKRKSSDAINLLLSLINKI
jgi:hydroxymethylpyrimidine pyrophosphatase-like HAD family hydrolase